MKFPSNKKWRLQYKATRDGFGAQNFHSKCDGVSNTLTIIKSTKANIFGGFTEKAWNSVGQYIADPEAFIFSLVNRENRFFKLMCTNGANAIRCCSFSGPIFGEDHDIHIASDSNSNRNSYSHFGHTYKQNSKLAGSRNFQTLEIKVFVATN